MKLWAKGSSGQVKAYSGDSNRIVTKDENKFYKNHQRTIKIQPFPIPL